MDKIHLGFLAGFILSFYFWLLVAGMSVQFTTASDIPVNKKQYEICRDKLFTIYPEEVNQKAWRNCINGKD